MIQSSTFTKKASSPGGCRLAGFDSLAFLVGWSICKERIVRTFGGPSTQPMQLLDQIVVYGGICTPSDAVGAPLVGRIVCCHLSFYVIALYVLPVELQSSNLAFAILFALFL